MAIVEMLPEPLITSPPMASANRIMLLDLLAFYNVPILNDSTFVEVTDDGIVIANKSDEKREIKADTVVLALGLKSDDELYESLMGKVTHLYKLGDCREPRKVMGAIWDGYEVGRMI